MSDELTVKQSYHGTGSSEGYVWKVFNGNNYFLGELESLSSNVNIDSVCRIHDRLYIVQDINGSEIPEEIDTEVAYFKLKRWEYTPDFELKFKHMGGVVRYE